MRRPGLIRPRVVRRPKAGAIGLAALLAAPTALAAGEPEPITLAWASVPGCPGERDVRAEIERVLGGPPNPASRRYLRAEARVSRAGTGFHVHLVTDLGGVTGERDLDGPTCAAVANATALIVALTFDPEALERRNEVSKAAPPPAPPGVPPPPPPPATPKATPEPSTLPEPLPAALQPAPAPGVPRVASRPKFALGVVGSASIGALPMIGAGVGGRASVLAGRFRADLSGSYWPERSVSLPTRSTAGGRIRLAAGDASACWAVLRTPLELSPCLGLELGSMSGTGFGVRSDLAGSTLWIAPVAEAAAALPIGNRFAARLDLGVLVPIQRPPFVLTGAGTVYAAGPVVGRATLGVELRF
jgi:hypothetical protein